jgi:hypothetical protein
LGTLNFNLVQNDVAIQTFNFKACLLMKSANHNNSHRPPGITAICVLLAGLACTGFGNAIVWNDAALISAASTIGLDVGGPLFAGIAGFYGTTALVCSASLWAMRKWAIYAYVIWAIAAIALGIYFALGYRPAPTYLKLLLVAALIGVLALGLAYVLRVYRAQPSGLV